MISRELVAVDAEFHSGLEALLLKDGSKQKSLYSYKEILLKLRLRCAQKLLSLRQDLLFLTKCVAEGLYLRYNKKKEKMMTNLIKMGVMFFFIVLFPYICESAEGIDTQVMKTEFQLIDANKDGFITSEEMQDYQERRFNKLDADKNGVHDAKEIESDKANISLMGDKNKDKTLTKEESSSQFKEYFQGVDANKDGKLSEEEYTTYWPVVAKF